MHKDKPKIKVDPHSIISLDGVMELIQNPRKLLWVNFKAGFVRGFAGVIGAALAIVIITFLVAKLGGIPLIGDFLKHIGDAIKSAN